MRPNLIIIGAQKCGTSALHYYLDQHPDIAMSSPKELDFFIEDRNWHRGLDWYEQHWPDAAMIRGEASPNYASYPKRQRVAEKMASIVPGAKLILMVRDPIARLVSHYMHDDANGRVDRDFRTTVLEPGNNYVDRSRYMLQLEQFLRHYKRIDILVMDAGELRHDRAAALRRAFGFLGVDDRFSSDKYGIDKHKTSDKRKLNPVGAWAAKVVPKRLFQRLERHLPLGSPIVRPRVDDDLRGKLAALLKDDADRFREFTGMPFSGWTV